jgi:hypothetical protein
VSDRYGVKERSIRSSSRNFRNVVESSRSPATIRMAALGTTARARARGGIKIRRERWYY